MNENKPSLFSTKPEAIGFLKSGECSAVAWRQKGGADRGKIIVAEMSNGKIKTRVESADFYRN